uniref:Uncharacterized protein n=1 Tax=Arundo donax TaxID=35708 RepID=A0A0A8ZRV2_ARUDO
MDFFLGLLLINLPLSSCKKIFKEKVTFLILVRSGDPIHISPSLFYVPFNWLLIILSLSTACFAPSALPLRQ